MNTKAKAILKELINAAKPFTSADIVDETSGTIPLMERLKEAIEKAEIIGAFSSPSDYFVSLIDEVRIYNRALSAKEAQWLYMNKDGE